MSMHPPACPGDAEEREAAAARLGAERRRVFMVSAALSIASPVILYLSGTWESVWFGLAATDWPFTGRIALFLVGVNLTLGLVLLPVTYYGSYVVPHAFGLSRQNRRAWFVDWLKGSGVSTLFGVLLGGAYLWSVIVLHDVWWLALGLVVSVVGVVLVFVTPYVLVPLFFKMRPLADSAVVERVQALVAKAGTPVRDVCSLDFSRRTAEANAAVIGMGRSRRVVIADTLLAEFSPDELDAVVAHELGHHVHRDVQRLLLGNALLVWGGLALAAWFGPKALPVLSVPELAYVPAYPMLLAVVELFFLLTSPLLNWWSRRLETNADRYALRLTANPLAFATAMQRLGSQNLAETCPPRWAEVLLASHPALHRRIALARAWSAST
jgi:STE24 endopeptidase